MTIFVYIYYLVSYLMVVWGLQMFRVLLPNGNEVSFTLGAFLREEGIFKSKSPFLPEDTSFYRDLASGALPAQCVAPAPVTNNLSEVDILTRHVHRLFAFYRWAAVPAEQRLAMELRDRQTALIARTAAQHAQRQMLMQKVASGKLTPRQAFQQARAYEAALSPAPRSPAARAPHSGAGAGAGAANGAGARGSPSVVNTTCHNINAHSTYNTVTPGEASASSAAAAARSLRAPHAAESSVQRRTKTGTIIPTVTPDVSPEWQARRSNINLDLMGEASAIQQKADEIAGRYLFDNVNISATKDDGTGALVDPTSLRKPTLRAVTAVTPPSALPNGNREKSDHVMHIFKIQQLDRGLFIPDHHSKMPNYSPNIDLETASYLGCSVVQSALDSSESALDRNRKFLARRSSMI
jgi:hypothetical protein